jgi:Beta-ketoacyl synthase, N-terminal domain
VAGWAQFDAAAFNTTPAEAGVMDPQQRVLLEVQLTLWHWSFIANRSHLLAVWSVCQVDASTESIEQDLDVVQVGSWSA